MDNIPPKDTFSREDYQYTYTAFAKVGANLKYPMAETVLFEDSSLTKGQWTKDVVSTLLRIQSNQAMYDAAIEQGSVCRLIWYIRLSRLLSNAEYADEIEWIYKAILWTVQKISQLFGQKPKSEDIEYDVKQNNPNNIAMVENRIASMVSDIEKSVDPHPKTTVSLSIQNYQDLFQIIYLPRVANYTQEDKVFAAQRVAGANPLVIERFWALLENFPVTDEQYQSVMGDTDSLQKAMTEKRLYITDYKVLEDIQPNITGEVQKYIYQPIALFAVEPGNWPNRRLVPVAIQCYQDPSPANPIFTAPSLNASSSDRWAWQMAKLIVQIADGNYHEFISHLGGTHLRMEPIGISTYRKLPVEHPLGALLIPHLEGTLFINDSAVNGLVQLGGTVDKVAAGTLESSLLLSVKGAKDYPVPFDKSSLPMELKRRGVDDPQLLPDYPYRDDALLIWNAIYDWVSSYLKVFYLDDRAVQTDRNIQDWIEDLTAPNGGQMTGIGETTDDHSTPQIRTLTYLIDVVTLIIFTGSAQHAAVNFPQASFMSYMPNMPLAGYGKAPRKDVEMTQESYLALLPSLTQSETQLNMTYLLGSIYYTQLGHYDSPDNVPYFKDASVQAHLREFQDKLEKIELEINARNEVRSTHYDVLRPSKIPQSINI